MQTEVCLHNKPRFDAIKSDVPLDKQFIAEFNSSLSLDRAVSFACTMVNVLQGVCRQMGPLVLSGSSDSPRPRTISASSLPAKAMTVTARFFFLDHLMTFRVAKVITNNAVPPLQFHRPRDERHRPHSR